MRFGLIILVFGLLVPAAGPVAAREPTPRDARMARFLTARDSMRALRAFAAATPVPDSATAATAAQTLGARLYSDRNLSLYRNQSCATCHELKPAIDRLSGKPLPAPGFVDPRNVQQGSAVSAGSIAGRFGTLNAPSAGYAAFSPFFHWDADEGLYVGGQFWNGRANTLQEQAAQPFLNPNEMAMPNQSAVVVRLTQDAAYQTLFRQAYNVDIGQALLPAALTMTGGRTPPAVLAVYEAMTKAIAAFEKSRVFNRFTSKFDFYLAGMTTLSDAEQRGLELFNGAANCAACHISTPGIAPDGNTLPPLFTDFTYDNIGLPRNVNIPGNPAPNGGLGARDDVAARDPSGSNIGKHKVMSLRNIAITPPYGHNGVFATLEGITHFYNTRDVLGSVKDANAKGFGVDGWPASEEPRNVNRDELGALGLSEDEEADVVAFMRTLTDGYPTWGKDANVPPGTPSPYAQTALPPSP